MFISQTRLVERFAGAPPDATPLDPPVERARFAALVPDVPTAMSYVAPAQRPAPERWGAYALRYDLRCSIVLNPIGVRAGAAAHLLVLYDVWPTAADRVAGTPPSLRNSHEFALRRGLTRDELRQRVYAAIEDYLIRASLEGLSGDRRDPRHRAVATEDDPTGEYAKVRDLRDVTRNVNTAASDPSPAPLLTAVPK